MELKAVQTLFAQGDDSQNGSARQAVGQLKATVDKALGYLKAGNVVQAQVCLENAFSGLVQAMHYLDLDLENVVAREKARREAPPEKQSDRVIFVFSDHAELRVDGELRGTIALYGPEDYQELDQIAQLFSCRIQQADSMQLDLFHTLTEKQDAA